MNKKIILIAMIAILISVLFYFSPEALSTRLKTPTPVPSFSYMDINGDTLDLNKFKNKVVILNFWASWSRTSRLENKNMVRLYNKYKNNSMVEFVSISLDTDEANWKTAIEEDELTWKNQLCDFKKYESPMAKSFKVSTIPSVFLINKSSTITKSSNKVAEIENEIDALLK